VMNAAELGAYIRANFTDHPEPAGRGAFRLETLPAYEVASDGSDFARYLAGEAAPTPERKQPWLARLRHEKERGLHRSRVHVVDAPLSDYLRYECEWSYVPNGEAGEEIRILDRSEVRLTVEHDELFTTTGDFWLLNGEVVVRMNYDEQGRFIGAEIVSDDVAVYQRAAEAAWTLAKPFLQWWARHPQYWRTAP
jgi:hypothetical protein